MSPTLAIVLLVAANAVTAGLMLLVRRRAPEGSYFHDTTEASGVFPVAGTAYHDADAFTTPIAARVHGELVCYARSVIYQEWPAMADGHASPVTEL